MRLMRRLMVVAGTVVLLGLVAVVVLTRPDASPGVAPAVTGAPADDGVVARGKYLVTAADCTACHTVGSTGKPFAGGVAFKLPFGTLYSTNISPDRATGIGNWTDDEFVRAMQQGIRRDGQHLYPAFPYTSYTQLSRADVLAIKAYLFTLPPVVQANRANDLGFPFNQRWAMAVWNAAFFKSGRFMGNAAKSPVWNSGAYLGLALGHCAECHTPRNFAFGLEQGNALSGETVQGWHASNITSSKTVGIGNWSEAEITSYLSTGHAAGRGSATGPMGEAVANSLQYLTPEDMHALVTWLRDTPSREGKAPIYVDSAPAGALASGPASPGGPGSTDHPAGLRLFESACASCHQWNGQGQQSAHASLLGSSAVNDPAGLSLTMAVLQGARMRVAGQDVYMPAFGDAYSDTEIAELANYVIAHFGNKQGTVTAADVAARRKL